MKLATLTFLTTSAGFILAINFSNEAPELVPAKKPVIVEELKRITSINVETIAQIVNKHVPVPVQAEYSGIRSVLNSPSGRIAQVFNLNC